MASPVQPAEQVFPINPQLGDVNIRLSPALEARLGAALDTIAGSAQTASWAIAALCAVAVFVLWRRS